MIDPRLKGHRRYTKLSGLHPGETMMVGGLDWSWAFAVFRFVEGSTRYFVGSDGSAWTTRSGEFRLLSPNLYPTGHLGIRLSLGGPRFVSKTVNRFVIETFLGPPPPGMECCHNNGKPDDNRISNLRWGTRQDNINDQVKHGVLPRGESRVSSKLVESEVREIFGLAASGVRVAELAEQYSIDKDAIYNIINGKRWTHLGLGAIDRSSLPRRPNFKVDLGGRRFGQLVVEHPIWIPIPNSSRNLMKWLCRCDCGNRTTTSTNALTKGLTSSCGRWCRLKKIPSRYSRFQGATNC